MAREYTRKEVAEMLLQLLDTPDDAMMEWLGLEAQYIGQGTHDLVIWDRDVLVREVESAENEG